MSTSAGKGRVSMGDDPKGPKPKAVNNDGHSSSSMKAPQSQANSQKTTTAPSVKMPSVTLVTDSKGKTARERLVDEYNGVKGGDQRKTYLERQFAEGGGTGWASSERNTGSAAKLKGVSKQAQ